MKISNFKIGETYIVFKPDQTTLTFKFIENNPPIVEHEGQQYEIQKIINSTFTDIKNINDMYYIIKYTEQENIIYKCIEKTENTITELQTAINNLKSKGIHDYKICCNKLSFIEFGDQQSNGFFTSPLALDIYFADSKNIDNNLNKQFNL